MVHLKFSSGDLALTNTSTCIMICDEEMNKQVLIKAKSLVLIISDQIVTRTDRGYLSFHWSGRRTLVMINDLIGWINPANVEKI